MIRRVRLAATVVVLQRLVESISLQLLLPSSRCESFSLPAVPASPRCPPRPRRGDPRGETPSRRRRRRRRRTFALPDDDGGSPPPSSNYDAMDHLRERARRQESQYADLFSAALRRSGGGGRPPPPPGSVHLVLFHPGAPAQSVHTVEYPMGSGDNWILAFEDGDDCVSFANELRRDNLEYADPSVSWSGVSERRACRRGPRGTLPGPSNTRDSRLVQIFHPSPPPPPRLLPLYVFFVPSRVRRPPPQPEETMFEPFARHCELSATRFVVVPGGFGLTPPQANAADVDDYSDDDDEDVSEEEDDDVTTNDEASEEGDVYDSGAWG